MRLVIVTGMSGAGKSTAMKMMEDMGFFCIDNLPIPLLDKLVDFTKSFDTQQKKIAIGIDARSGESLDSLNTVLDELSKKDIKYEILFLDAEDNVLVKRYKGQGNSSRAMQIRVSERKGRLYYRYEPVAYKRIKNRTGTYLCKRRRV